MKYSRRFQVELFALYEGRRTFDVFAIRTAQVWRGLAVYLYRKWTPPAGCTLEDVEQELLLAVWRELPKFDPRRGKSLAQFITWNACNHAKTYLHKQRGCNLHGNRDKNPSRYAASFSSFGEETANRFAARIPTAPTQEQDLDRKRALDDVMQRCRTPRERLVLAALAVHQGSVELAAHALYDDATVRLACRLGSIEQAKQLARRTVNFVQGLATAA